MVGGGESGAIECHRVQVLVLCRSEEFWGPRVENRQRVDDGLDAVGLVRGMEGRNGESRHIGRQMYTCARPFSVIGDPMNRAFEVSDKLLEVGLGRRAMESRGNHSPGRITWFGDWSSCSCASRPHCSV